MPAYISQITTVDRVGRLDGINTWPLSKLSFIYGENGCGKSTLAHVLRILGNGDHQSLSRLRRYGATSDPVFKVTFSDGQVTTLTPQTQNGPRIRAAVFDQRFVDQNVYSGMGVTTAQRTNLHTYALGEASARANLDHQRLVAQEQAELADLNAKAESARAYFAGAVDSDLSTIQADPNADQKLVDINRKISAARTIADIRKRPQFPLLRLDLPDLADFSAVLRENLLTLDTKTRSLLETHFAKLGEGSKSWAAKGKTFEADGECPYCGQRLTNDLISAHYAAFFNQEYADLVKRIRHHHRLSEDMKAAVGVETLRASTQQGLLAEGAWEDLAYKQPTLDIGKIEESLAAVSIAVEALYKEKAENPGSVPQCDQVFAEINARLQDIGRQVDEYNAVARAQNQGIAAYVANLATENLIALNRQEQALQWSKLAATADGVRILREYHTASTTLSATSRAKDVASRAAKTAAAQVAQTYQTGVNDYLHRFGASFRLKGFEDRNQGKKGGAERNVVYGFGVAKSNPGEADQHDVDLNSFGEALSDGDKRTLALAFFLAQLTADPHLQDTIVILDDPVCSLSAFRRSETRDIIYELAHRALQVIVLCHDGSFMIQLIDDTPRSLQQHLTTSELLLNAGRSTIQNFDDKRHRETTTLRAVRRAKDYASNQTSWPEDTIYADLRISLEGYLKVKYYPALNNCKGLGEMVNLLGPTGPLASMGQSFLSTGRRGGSTTGQELVALQRDLNCPHHGAYNPIGATPQRQQLLSLTNRVLAIVHG